MWTMPSVVSIFARWLPSRTSSTISGWSPSAVADLRPARAIGRDEVDPDAGVSACRSSSGSAGASRPSPSQLWTSPTPRRMTVIVPGCPARADRAAARRGRRAGSAGDRARHRAARPRFGRVEAIGVGSSGSGAPARVSVAAGASSSIRVRPARAAERQPAGPRRRTITGGRDDEQPDHDRRRLARRPVLERVDDERVAQRAVAQRLRDELPGTRPGVA